jgi:hypothetical protein
VGGRRREWGGSKRGCWGKRGEMTQTLYAHMNKRKKIKIKISRIIKKHHIY